MLKIFLMYSQFKKIVKFFDFFWILVKLLRMEKQSFLIYQITIDTKTKNVIFGISKQNYT